MTKLEDIEGVKIHLRADEANGIHTRFTVFMNGANCGQLCMAEKEAMHFHEIILKTFYKLPQDDYRSSGHWFIDKEIKNDK